MQSASDAILVAVVVTAAVTDLRKGRIYNVLVYPAIALGLALGVVDGVVSGDGALAGLRDHGVAAAVAFGIMFACYAIGGMGGGDVKLMTAVGALGGWARPGEGNFILFAMFYSFAAGAILGIVAAMWKRALGAVLARTWLGVRMFMMPGTSLEESVPRGTIGVPFGFATCLGTLWVLTENYAGVSLGSLVSRLTHGG